MPEPEHVPDRRVRSVERLASAALILVFALVPPGLSPGRLMAADFMRCASTTSTRNSGLLNYLLPRFENISGIQVQVIAVGTGAALELGKRGDVDCVLVHDMETELKLVDEGWFVQRRNVMYNDFVLLGPADDPAGVRDAGTAAEAFAIIRNRNSTFVSRGDDSGTHKKELTLWRLTGGIPEPREDEWYLSAGQGMAKTLRIAEEKLSYVLSDRGTWLALQEEQALKLKVLFSGDPILFNQYGVMAVSPQRHRHVLHERAMVFIDWLTSEAGQHAIGAFRDSRGNQLFVPNAH